MQPENSLSCPHEPGTGSYLVPDTRISNTQPHAPFPYLNVIPETVKVRDVYRLVPPTQCSGN
jgi:hypothetical protein